MSDKSFFDGWVGRAVEFTNTVEPSRGTLEAICGDHKNQLSTKAYFESEGTRGKPSAAYGALRCRNIYNPDEVAFMRIIMQIPAGFEYAMSPERSRQATDALPSMTCNELKCLKIITKNNCKSAPIIRHHPVVEQDDNGLVLGGFLHYILMDHASGYNWNGAEAWSRGTTSSGPLASKSELASATLSTRHRVHPYSSNPFSDTKTPAWKGKVYHGHLEQWNTFEPYARETFNINAVVEYGVAPLELRDHAIAQTSRIGYLGPNSEQ